MRKVCTFEQLLNTPDEELSEKERKWKAEQLEVNRLAKVYCPLTGESCRLDCALYVNGKCSFCNSRQRKE